MRPRNWIPLLAFGTVLAGCRDRPLDTQDSTPPAAISDLAAGDPIDTTLHLSWSSSGDDGESGTASLYEIRYSTRDLADENALNVAPRILLPDENRGPRRITLAVGSLDRGRIYYFRVRAADEVSNWGVWSNVASSSSFNTPPEPRAELSADSLALGDTLLVDASGTRDAESATLDLRWDWNADGVWDTPWSPERVFHHAVTRSGRYGMILEVRDEAAAVTRTEIPIVVSGFACHSRKTIVIAHVRGGCCTFASGCLHCDVVAQDSSMACSDSQLEREVNFQRAQARAAQTLDADLGTIHVVPDLVTFVDQYDDRNECLARASTTTEIEIFTLTPFEARVQWDIRSVSASGSWSLRLYSAAHEVLSMSGQPSFDPDHATQKGALEPGIYTLETVFETNGTTSVHGDFALTLGVEGPTGKATP